MGQVAVNVPAIRSIKVVWFVGVSVGGRQMTRDKYTVWKIGMDGTYAELVKEYKTFKGACNRANREAESQWRSGVKYIVSHGFSDGDLLEGKKASQVGMDGIEYSGNSQYEVEV